MKLAHITALFCGITPLVIATFILTGYIFTGNESFVFAGIINLYIGFGLFVIGISSLINYEYQYRKAHKKSTFKILLKPLLILLLNFPAAIVCLFVGSYMSELSTVTVINHTQESIPIIELAIRERIQKPILEVLPKQTTKKYIRFDGEGSVSYAFELNGEKQEGELISYTTSTYRHRVKITIAPNGQVKVDEENEP